MSDLISASTWKYTGSTSQYITPKVIPKGLWMEATNFDYTPFLLGGVSPQYVFANNQGTPSGALNIVAFSTHGDGGFLDLGNLLAFNKSRGTALNPTALTQGARVANMVAGGYDGASYNLVFTGLRLDVDGAVSVGTVPIEASIQVAGQKTATWGSNSVHTQKYGGGNNAIYVDGLNSRIGIDGGTLAPTNTISIGNLVTADVNAYMTITPPTSVLKGLIIQAQTSQTANLQEWQNSAGRMLGAVDPSGTLILETQSARTPAANTKSYIYTAVDSQNAAADALYIAPARYGGGRLYIGDVSHGSIYAVNFSNVQNFEALPKSLNSAGGNDGYFVDATRNAFIFAVNTYGYDMLFAIPGPGFITGPQTTGPGYHRDIRFKSWAADADTMETSSATSNYIFDTKVTNTVFPHTKWRENGVDIFTLKADGGVTATARSAFPKIGIDTGATAAVGKLDIAQIAGADVPHINMHKPTSSASKGWNIAIGQDGNYAGRLKFYGEGQNENNWSLALLNSEDGWGASSTYRFSAPTFASFINGRGDSDISKWTNDGANSISGTYDAGQSYAYGGAPATFSKFNAWIGSTATSTFNVVRHTDVVNLLSIQGSTGNITPIDGANLVLNATTGMKIGTATTQKLGFYNATPIVQPANTVAIDDTLVNIGLRASGLYANFTTTVQPRAGTASANTAPLKFTTGTSLTTPEAGAVEYDGNHYKTKANAIRFSVGGILFDHFADAGNTTTTETDLYTATLAASTLANNGEKITAHYGGTMVNSATATRQLKVYFGGTVIFDSGAITLSAAASWTVNVNVVRDSATTVRCDVALNLTGASTGSYASYTAVTGLTLTNTQIIKITGTAAGAGAATNDIVAKLGYVEYKSKA